MAGQRDTHSESSLPSTSSGFELESEPTTQTSHSLEAEIEDSLQLEKENIQDDEREGKKSCVENRDSVNTQFLSDPGLWPSVVSDSIKLTLVEMGPIYLTEKNLRFPLDLYKRCFSSQYYSRHLSNGEVIPRVWLVYSKSKNLVFCFPCKLFEGVSNPFLTGYNDWQHLAQATDRHEKSKSHISCTKLWVDLRKSLAKLTTTDSLHQQQINFEKERWKKVITIIIHCVKYFAQQNLAFRGAVDKLFEAHNGNFLKLIETVAQFNDVIADHLNRIKNKQ